MRPLATNLINFSNKVYSHRFATALRKAFLQVVPLIMIGSFAVLLNNLPIPFYQSFMAKLFGDAWRSWGGNLWQASYGIISLALSYTIATCFAELHTPVIGGCMPSVYAGLVSVACFLLMSIGGDGTLPLGTIGGNGIFVAMVITLASSQLFMTLYRLIPFRQDRNGDQTLSQALLAMLPALVVLALFTTLRMLLLTWTGHTLHDLIYAGLQHLFTGLTLSLSTAFSFVFSSQFFWFLGIHGNNVLEPVAQGILVPAMAANEATALAGSIPPNLFTKPFFDVFVFLGGAGSTLCLLTAIFYTIPHSSSTHRLGRQSLLLGLCNINETMVFGLPVVLNPIFLIPFLATPMLLTVTTWLAMSSGLVPYTAVSVEWTTPIILGGYISTGSWTGAALQMVNLALGTLIYVPFVRLSEMQRSQRQQDTLSGLYHAVDDKINRSAHVLLNRTDDVGNMARSLADDIKYAMRNETLRLEFQPLVDETGRVHAFETLLRWTHPTYGNIPPPTIIALAEEYHLVYELGWWIIRQACAQLAQWKARGMQNVIMAVNISPRQLRDPQLVRVVQDTLLICDLQPGELEIEIIETGALGVDEVPQRTLDGLHDMGVKLSMDDFGMGHSSLLHLRRFSIDTLKFDGSLIRDLLTDSLCQDIVKSMIQLCGTMDIQPVAEFVETSAQREMLIDMGCPFMQGYLFSKPLTAEKAWMYYRAHE